MKWAGVAFMLLCLAYEYAPALTAGFVYEDARNVAAGASLSTDDLTPRRMSRLLTRLSWRWQSGQSPLAFHALNLSLHLIVALLVAALVRDVSGSPTAGAVAASLFVVYPLHMESVAYLTGRSELIAAIGVLFACLCSLRRQWLGVVLGLGFGLLGKESAVAGVPLVALVRLMRDGWTPKIGSLFVGSGVVLACAAWMFAPHEAAWHWQWTALQMVAWVRHASQTVLPVASSVDVNYRAMPFVAVILSAVCLVGFASFAWTHRVSTPLIAGGMAWMLFAALPRFVTVTPGSILNEHQFYLPRIGAAFIVAHGWMTCRA